MKTLLTIFLLTLSVNCFSQLKIVHNSNGSVDWHFPTEVEAEDFKQRVLFQDKDLQTADSTIKFSLLPAIEKAKIAQRHSDSAIVDCQNSVIEYKSQIAKYQSDLINLGTQSKPLFEWIGFYVGAGTGYVFADSVIGKETIINNLWNNISLQGTGYLRIKDFMLTGSFGIPFRSKPMISIGIGYKVF